MFQVFVMHSIPQDIIRMQFDCTHAGKLCFIKCGGGGYAIIHEHYAVGIEKFHKFLMENSEISVPFSRDAMDVVVKFLLEGTIESLELTVKLLEELASFADTYDSKTLKFQVMIKLNQMIQTDIDILDIYRLSRKFSMENLVAKLFAIILRYTQNYDRIFNTVFVEHFETRGFIAIKTFTFYNYQFENYLKFKSNLDSMSMKI